MDATHHDPAHRSRAGSAPSGTCRSVWLRREQHRRAGARRARHPSCHPPRDGLRGLVGIPAGGSLVIVAPHDPKPLLAQIADRDGPLTVTYLVEGPDAWRLELTRA